MKASYITALLTLATSAFAAAVVANDDTTPTESVYNWTVIESGFDTPEPSPHSNWTSTDLVKRVGTPSISCYNSGRAVQRAALTSSIDMFCNNIAIGQTLSNGQNLWVRYLDEFSGITVLVYMNMINNCSPWKIDNQCNVNFRYPVDNCNTEGVNNKQGGEMHDGCAHYRIDPGDRNSNDV